MKRRQRRRQRRRKAAMLKKQNAPVAAPTAPVQLPIEAQQAPAPQSGAGAQKEHNNQHHHHEETAMEKMPKIEKDVPMFVLPTIEKNVPMPFKRGVNDKWDFLMKMEVGDSFQFPETDKKVWMNAAYQLQNAKRKKVDFAIRGTRLWRMK